MLTLAEKEQLRNCQRILVNLETPSDGHYNPWGGWAVSTTTIRAAGIDLAKLYTLMGQLAQERIEELEKA